MKKTLLAICGVLALAGASSCNSGSSGTETVTVTTYTINLVTSVNDGVTVANIGTYRGVLDILSQTGQISTASSLVFNNTTMSMMTDEGEHYTSTGYNAYFKYIGGTVAGAPSGIMENGTFLITPWYYPVLENINSYLDYNIPNYQFTGNNGNILVARYNIGDEFIVRTFQTDTFYAGNTISYYNNTSATNEGILYRLVLDVAKNTATIIMYNAKFSNSEQEPVKTVVVPGLDVSYSAAGVTVTGTGIVPQMVDGQGLTNMDRYTFDEITFQSTGDMLMGAKIDFVLSELQYSGSFTGTYVYDEILKN